jgi:inosine-uridine nucleoside N-ribohydrolase
MKFPAISESTRLARLQPPKNTFHNDRSSGPADGMEKSYEEILRLLDKMQWPADDFVWRGSTAYLDDNLQPQESEAAADLVARAMSGSADDLLYVVGIGAITNVASAILMQPEIVDRIVVVWLGGHALHWPHTREFNLWQDVPASRLIFDCGVPLVHVPAMGVASHLLTTVSELEALVLGNSEVGDYLVDIVKGYHANHFGWSKIIWDISTIAYLINPNWVPTELVNSPIVTDELTWSFDSSRHLIRCATYVFRDSIFRDLFTKLNNL